MLIAEESDQKVILPGVLVAAVGTGRPTKPKAAEHQTCSGWDRRALKSAFVLKTLEEQAILTSPSGVQVRDSQELRS